MDCPHIPLIAYGEFSKDIHDKAKAQRIPIGGTIELTYRCNLNCIHCYCNLAADDKEEIKKELSYEQVCRFIDDAAGAGCLWFLFTGGDPFVRRDFLDIYMYAKKKGIIVTIFTNGAGLNEKIVRCLKEYPPFIIEITLYSMNQKVHDSVTRLPGSLEKTLSAIELLLKYGITLTLKSTITKINKDEIKGIRNYNKRLGLPNFRFDPLLNPRYDGSQKPCSLRLSPDEVIKLDLEDDERSKALKEFCEERLPSKGKQRVYNCEAGISSFCLNPYGNLQVCQMVAHYDFNIKSLSFQEIWYNLFPKVFSRKVSSDYKCASCNIEDLCSICPGWVYMECGKEEGVVRYLCEIAKLRKECFWR